MSNAELMIVAESIPDFERDGEYWKIHQPCVRFAKGWRDKIVVEDFVELRLEHRYVNFDGQVETLFVHAPLLSADCSRVKFGLYNAYNLSLQPPVVPPRHAQVEGVRSEMLRLNSSREYVVIIARR